MSSDRDFRISATHRSRHALVYVRQSSPGQVRSNTESTRIQLDLRQRAIELGWSQPIVVDDDLGLSASGFAERPGFQQLLARVAMREVGIILCVDASRLSRNSKDWAQLFELCGFFDTLIADPDQVYDLSQPNDRLIMGIKGTVSEMELVILRRRLRLGVEAKAARGELRFNLPAGYAHDPTGEIAFDPDKRVQAALRLMFDQFDRHSSVRQLAMWYRDTATLFPVKLVRKNTRTSWEVPTSKTLHKLLVHPLYAGAYVYGRRVVRVEYQDGKLVKRVGDYLPAEQCRACIRDHHPAYISWERLVANEAKISENRPRWSMDDNRGAVRDGLALLAGIARCGHCGARVYVSYKAESALYVCDGGNAKGSRRCFSLGSKAIDRKIGDELCRAVEPLAIDAALEAAAEADRQRDQELESARLRVQAAQYAANRAFEQFDAVDPRNRLVADTLELRLNDKLSELTAARAELEMRASIDTSLAASERRRMHELAHDVPRLWAHPAADPVLKKQLLRAAVEEIILSVERDARQARAVVHWKGGCHTEVHVKKRFVAKGGPADPELISLVASLAPELRSDEIARVLNLQKLTTPRGLVWTRDRVNEFRKHHRIPGGKPPQKPDDQLTQAEAAAYLGISRNGLCGLVSLGAVAPNQITDFAPWRVSRTELDSPRVRELVATLKAAGRLPKGGCPEGQRRLFDR